MEDLSTAILSRQPHIVGAVGDHRVLDATIAQADCDLIELRLDALGCGAEVQQFAERLKASHPIVLTARHPDEGGANELSAAERASALAALLPHGALIDVELQSLSDLADTWAGAGERGLLRIASWHDFTGCPTVDELLAKLAAMHEAGADIAKFAFRLDDPADIQAVVGILRADSPLPLAVMGMGPLAPASRLLAAQLGSVLNYGYLGSESTAPGQWSARLLKEAVNQSR